MPPSNIHHKHNSYRNNAADLDHIPVAVSLPKRVRRGRTFSRIKQLSSKSVEDFMHQQPSFNQREDVMDRGPILSKMPSTKQQKSVQSQVSLSEETGSTTLYNESWSSTGQSFAFDSSAHSLTTVSMSSSHNRSPSETASTLTPQTFVSYSEHGDRSETRSITAPKLVRATSAQTRQSPSFPVHRRCSSHNNRASHHMHTGPVDVDEAKPIVDLENYCLDDADERRDGPVDLDEIVDIDDDDDDDIHIYEEDFVCCGEEDFSSIMMGYAEGFEPRVIDISPSSPSLSYQMRRKFSAEAIPRPIAEHYHQMNVPKQVTKRQPVVRHDAVVKTKPNCSNCRGRDCGGIKFCI